MKTVREASQELNISRQALYSKLTTDFKARFTTIKKINNRDTLVISSDGIKELEKDIVKVDSQVDKGVDSQVDNQIIDLLDKNIKLLQQQLQEKDKQIQQMKEDHKEELKEIKKDYKEQLKVKDQQIENLTELNRNNQILLGRGQEQKALPGGTVIDKIKNFFNKEG